MTDLEYDILTTLILERMKQTSVGHCARVDYLGRDEAIAICQRLSEGSGDLQLAAHILVPDTAGLPDAGFHITTDQAIALRNRKQTRVCLFVPADMVDAAFSSLANSFETMDGPELHTLVLRELLERLPIDIQQTWRAVFKHLRRTLTVSVDQQLDFVGTLHAMNEAGTSSQAGMALWRVGLIADARPDFTEHLDKNRDCVAKLTRPGKIHATTAERIQDLGVSAETATELALFFRNRALYDVRTWSKDVASGLGPTLERWVFPEEVRSNIRSVTIRPFIGSDGTVEHGCNLQQPDGPGGSLRAACGPKGKMVVRWITDPPSPSNLSRWHVEDDIFRGRTP